MSLCRCGGKQQDVENLHLDQCEPVEKMVFHSCVATYICMMGVSLGHYGKGSWKSGVYISLGVCQPMRSKKSITIIQLEDYNQ
jgi:hypothetical protein